MVRRALHVWLVCIAALSGSSLSCLSPTLPLPPPATPTVSEQSDGQYALSSTRGVESNAIVILVNHNTNIPASERVDGAQADAEGTWTEVIRANPGDIIDVTQEVGSTRSPPTSFQIPTK